MNELNKFNTIRVIFVAWKEDKNYFGSIYLDTDILQGDFLSRFLKKFIIMNLLFIMRYIN